MAWFYSYDLENGQITRFPFVRGAQIRRLNGFYASYGGRFMAFPEASGKINIVSGKNFSYKCQGIIKPSQTLNSIHDIHSITYHFFNVL